MAKSRFSRPEGSIGGPYPEENELQQALRLRMWGGCRIPLLDDERPDVWGSMLTLSIEPSFHAHSQAGWVWLWRAAAPTEPVGHRLAMVVGGFPAATATVDLPRLEAPLSIAPPRAWPPPPS